MRKANLRGTARLLMLSTALPVLCLLIAGNAVAQTRKLSLEMYFDWETVADPQISPDGRQIVYTRGWVDKVNDRMRTSLWVMNVDGSRNRFLTEGSSPRWSPDGTRVALLREGDPKGTQLFVRWMDAEGSVTQITRVEKTPSEIAWSPDSHSIAFIMLVPKKETWNIHLPTKPEGAKWTENPRIVEGMVYRRDRVGFLEEGSRHIFVVPAAGGTPRQLTTGDYDADGPLAWTPDGKEILFDSLRVADWEYQWLESEVYAINASEKKVRQLTTRKGPDANPVVSPDGKWVAYTGFDWNDDTYTASRLYVMAIDGSGPRDLSGGMDRSPEAMRWAADGSGIYFTTEDRGTRNVWFASVQGGAAAKPRAVTQGNHLVSLNSIGPNGIAVGILTAAQKPGDVVTYSLAKPEFKTLTGVNDDVLQDVKLGSVEEIWYTSVDDFKIQGWIVKPPDFDPQKKYPLMLAIHGGPHAMYNTGFNFGWQEHAANGYIVLYTNPRGSTGYGSAFGNAIKNAYPSKDFDDLMKGVDEVIAKGYLDTSRLYVYGCSGGGVLTAWTVGHTNRFAAASSNCPVINWLSFGGTTDINLWGYKRFAKPPWEDPMPPLQHSPLMYVGNVKTPTMLMTGVNDLRTPISQTEEFYQALKLRKVPTAMVRFNDEYHGTTSRPSNFMRTQLYLRYWFEKYPGKKETGAKAGE